MTSNFYEVDHLMRDGLIQEDGSIHLQLSIERKYNKLLTENKRLKDELDSLKRKLEIDLQKVLESNHEQVESSSSYDS